MSNQAQCIFSIDVEDWFHILDLDSTLDVSAWAALPSRVEANFMRLLDLLSEHDAHATCFFLGWIAERFPHLVREAMKRGHEIASHGFAHQLAYRTSRRDFAEDARSSRLLLEDITSLPVVGYRAAGFSVTDNTPWFFEELAAAGYRYDSSVFPAHHGHGGAPDGSMHPYPVLGGQIIEVPNTVVPVAGRRMCFFGGGYLRLFPYALVRHMTQRTLASGRPVVFYVHPREIDPDHPRLPMPLVRRFKSYVNLHTTVNKVRRIARDFPLVTFREYLSRSEFGAVLEPSLAARD